MSGLVIVSRFSDLLIGHTACSQLFNQTVFSGHGIEKCLPLRTAVKLRGHIVSVKLALRDDLTLAFKDCLDCIVSVVELRLFSQITSLL